MFAQIDRRPEAFTPYSAEQQESAPVTSYVDNHDISRIPETQLREIIDSTDGDERLFVATLGLHRFIQKMREGELGPNEDPVNLYDRYISDVERRRVDLGLVEHPVAHIDQPTTQDARTN